MTNMTSYFTTVRQVKKFLNITGNSTVDGTLATLIPGVGTGIEALCNRRFGAEQYTEYHDGNGRSGVIFVKNPPIISITNLYDDSVREFGTATRFNATTDFVVYNSLGKIKLVLTLNNARDIDGAWFSKGVQNIKAIYTGGWATCPPDVSVAASLCVADLYMKLDKRMMGVTSVSQQNTSVSYENRTHPTFSVEMPKEAISLLEPYILPL